MRTPIICTWSETKDGVSVRTWECRGRPYGPSIMRVLQSKELFYGPVPRPPGLWRRVLRVCLEETGRSETYYCRDLPPLRNGFQVSMLRLMVIVNWRTRRHNQMIWDHFRAGCTPCATRLWPRAEDAT